MTEAVILMQGVTKSFDGKRVLDQLNFDLTRGTVAGLLGKNGAGKTTLIKCALGLVRLQSGNARIFGEDAWNMSGSVKQRIGYVAQVMTGFNWMRVGDLLAYTGAFYQHWDQARVEQLVGEWELNPRAKVGALSEGQKQKLAIIQAMGHNPDLLILDEPVASLDPSARRKFLKQIIELNLSEERTILFSTHITSDIERVAAEVALLKDGRIGFQGDLDTLKDRVRRLHIQTQDPLPNPLPIEKVLSSHVEGTHATLTVEGLDDAAVVALEQDWGATISVETLNLEEIFLEYNQ